MPELPEVETMRRGILGVRGALIAKIRLPRCRLKPILVSPSRPTFRRRAQNRKIQDVERIGKRILLRLDGDEAMVFELRMTGLLLVTDPPDSEHLRLGLKLAGTSVPELWFWDRRGLGNVRLLTAKQIIEHLGPSRIGPDALELSFERLQDALGKSRREVKVALLDQRSIAGIGNLYASEILHQAGVHPQRRCDSISRRLWLAIHEAMQDVLTRAIRYEGSTLRDGTYRNALNQNGSFQNHHRVYKKTGQKCPSCVRGVIRRIIQAQRATFYCPKCQGKNV